MVNCNFLESNTGAQNNTIRGNAVTEAQGKTLYIPPGHFQLTSAATFAGVREVVAHSETVLDFSARTSGQVGKCIHSSGLGQSGATSHTLTANVAVGADTCTIAATTGLAVNQKVLIKSDQRDFVADGNESQSYGEVVKIKGITGSGPYTIEFHEAVRLPYTTAQNAKLVAVDLAAPIFFRGNGARIIGSGQTHTVGGTVDGDKGLGGDWCERFEAEGWNVENANYNGVFMDNCPEFHVSLVNVQTQGREAADSISYLYVPQGICNRGLLENFRGTGGASGVVHVGSGGDGFMFNLTVRDGSIINSEGDAYAEHSGLVNAVYDNVEALKCRRGFSLRGRNRKLKSPKVHDCYNATGGDAFQLADNASEIEILDMDVDNVRNVLIANTSDFSDNTAPLEITIRGGRARRFATGLGFVHKGGENPSTAGNGTYNTAVGGPIVIEGLKLYCQPPREGAASSLPIQVSGYWSELHARDCRIEYVSPTSPTYPIFVRGCGSVFLNDNVFVNTRGWFLGANTGGESVIDAAGATATRNPTFASYEGNKWISITTDVVPLVTTLTSATTRIIDQNNHASNVVLANDLIILSVGDETTALTTGTAKATYRLPNRAFVLKGASASLATASSSGIPTVDINEGGTTILSTKLTIDANEKTTSTAATAHVLSDTTIAANAEITVDIDVAGTGAAGLEVYLYGHWLGTAT